MLDIVTQTPKALENCRVRGGDVWSTHHDIGDTSLYENYAKFRPVPIEAQTTHVQHDVEFVEPQRMEGFSALQNVASGNVIDVTPFRGSYTLKPHDLLMQEQAEIIKKSELPLGNVEVCDRIYDEGVRVHRTIYFHDLTSHIGKAGDVVRCRLDYFNSVDKSWAFQVFSGAYRDLCRNTLVFGGEKAYHQKQKHTGTMSTEAMGTKATMGLDMWSNQSEQMKLWQQAQMTDRQFADIIKETLCRKNTKGAELEESISINQRRFNYLLEATHLPDARDVGRAERKRFNRNNDVRQIIDGPSWLYVEGLARGNQHPMVTA